MAQVDTHDEGHENKTHEGSHEEHHEELGFWRKYVFSVDHKVIGIQYTITGFLFLFFGFSLMLLMRWQLANPGEALPLIGSWFSEDTMPGGVMLPEFYNQLGAMHGTIMVFLGVVPLAFGGFGNYVVPLQIGAPDMAFPRLNMASYWIYFVGGIVMLGSFFVPGGAAQAGWTSYPPLAVINSTGQTVWLISMALLITSSLLGSVNFITTIVQLRAPGLTWWRLPFFVWAQLVTAFLLLLAFPPLEAAAFMQLMDRLADTSFFMPSGLVVGGAVLDQVSGGGSPILWQHLFWFLAHPEVYVLILPAMGIVAEVIANNTRKPLWGHKTMVYSVWAIGFLSFIVWAHHMFLTGMGTVMNAFFQTTTMIISVPSVIILTCLILSLWGGSIRFSTPMLFALAFLPMFGIGGLTGLPLGLAATDIHLHDTYYVIGHFHYVVAPGTIFALFAGIYYWFPKATGRKMSTWLGHLHFWPSFVCMNLIFFPMFIQGMEGMQRRLWDGGATYAHAQSTLHLHGTILWAAWIMAAFQLPFVFNFFWSIWKGEKVSENPWQATTLEWQAPSPPPHGNFAREPAVVRGP
ncbi:MAG: cbb3-type cytochrome c oxidase subunit I, partial [Acidobacteriota bacterium]